MMTESIDTTKVVRGCMTGTVRPTILDEAGYRHHDTIYADDVAIPRVENRVVLMNIA